MNNTRMLDAIRQSGENISHQRYQPDQTIFYPGNYATGLYILKEGKVKLERGDEWGRTQMLGVAVPGECIGYHSVFTKSPHHHMAVALTKVELIHLHQSAVPEFLAKHPDLMKSLLLQMAEENEGLQVRLSQAFGSSAHERISEAILKLREIDPERAWSRKDIAEWAGTTPETVTRTLQELEKSGLILLRGRAILLTQQFVNANQKH